MISILAIGIGGFFGAITRYIISGLATEFFAKNYLGTMFVNLTGSFLLGLFIGWVTEQTNFSEPVRLLIATGFFGAYTTFSTYAVEGVQIARSSGLSMEFWLSIIMVNVLSLLAALGGMWIGETYL